MATVDVLDQSGKVVGTRDLDAEVFGAEVRPALMHQVVVAALAARRAGTHATKTRGEVRGGGRKPWRQKGTGRARAGSTRAPHWTGGGVVFGPHPRDHAQRLPKKMRRAALRSALSAQAAEGRIRVVERLSFEEPKTREAAETLRALEAGGRVLLVLAGPDQVVEKSFRNLPEVRVTYAGGLSTYEVLAADTLLFTADALALAGRNGPAAEGPAAPEGAGSGGDDEEEAAS
ncbi:MAG TPA: 50S ribosomal protein L4 [Actinomycetota bacterium]|nr:50S ribosomal protein L4 [Actinomycetota bacterium]